MVRTSIPVTEVVARAYTVPTEVPESDGTLEWDATTVVVVEARAGGLTGIGYSYTDAGAVSLVASKLAPVVEGHDALDVAAAWARMVDALRNVGRVGVGATALSAVDVALWDLKARLLDVPAAVALDACRAEVPIYGSGGFCSYSPAQLHDQLAGWVGAGIPRVKIKVGRRPAEDPERLATARKAVGDDTALYVDANGAFSPRQAMAEANVYADFAVGWFEEPVSSDDLAGLAAVRRGAPTGIDVAAGEYGYTAEYFAAMLAAGAVDCLQADVTRCGGFTGFLKVAALCDAAHIDLSAHCAPQISAHACTAVWHLRHLEYFHDHVRIESLFFDGVLEPAEGGVLVPDRTRPGLGLDLRRGDIERFAVG
ncbi:MAG TPA: enolase C-terminal domain-like protein [Acidimicrobiales bacterium]|nr:enolase C-terminal domain-like protein [Acidimicrobiales bacterium]